MAGAADFSSEPVSHGPDDFPDLKWFDDVVHHPAISVPSCRTAYIKKLLKDSVLQGRKNVYAAKDSGNAETTRRILVLNVGVTHEILAQLNVDGDVKVAGTVQWVDSFPISRTYSDLTADEVLRKLLPPTITEVPCGFELVGHLAHVNLRDECLPYKYWIGKVLLDKNAPNVKTVVNKVDSINDSVFRTFEQEVLAGAFQEPDWSVTTVHEHGYSFQLDYRQVYWNSRLSCEHKRLVHLIQSTPPSRNSTGKSVSNRTVVVADLMAGVGPFAIPLTSTAGFRSGKHQKSEAAIATRATNICVYANDLNPISYHFLQINAARNKCANLHCSNVDARAFLHSLQKQVVSVDHVIMNLPATAPEFLDAFRGWSLETLPLVHVHCFCRKVSDKVNPNQAAIDRCAKALGCEISNVDVHVVRDVSPSKNMLCVAFQLPPKTRHIPAIVLCADRSVSPQQPQSKRAKF